jgi:hypothetical protein
MDPITEPSGLRKRLVHLGHLVPFFEGAPEHSPAAVAHAISAFQAAEQLTVTGVADAATLDALTRAHGS